MQLYWSTQYRHYTDPLNTVTYLKTKYRFAGPTGPVV